MKEIKTQIAVGLGVCLVAVIAAWSFSARNVQVNSEEEKNLYFLGTKFGTGVAALKLSESEVRIVARGFKDAIGNHIDPKVEDESRPLKLQEFLNGRKGLTKVENEKAGKAFVQKFVASGGKTTSSGLAYEIEKAGQGESPGPNDVVDIQYVGKLVDGTVFASSHETTAPTRYPLDKIISGWSEGIQLLKPGGKIKLVIPPTLAYGDNGSPPKVPAGATLVMDIELKNVTKLGPAKKPAHVIR